MYSMDQTINTIILNENVSLYDATLFITTNYPNKNMYINLDSIVNFIYNKLLLSNASKFKTKSIKQLGTYDFKGLTKKQIAKKILEDMSKLELNIFVYSIEYNILNELNIKKIQFEDSAQYHKEIIVVDVTDDLTIKLKTSLTLTLSSNQMKMK